MAQAYELMVKVGDMPEVRDAMASAADRIAELERALTEAVGYCSGRVGHIGASQVYTPQIDVRAAERWRAALAGVTDGGDDA